jgi:hypothetical protein
MADIAAPSQLLSSVATYPDPCPTSGPPELSPRTLPDSLLGPPSAPIQGDPSKHKISSKDRDDEALPVSQDLSYGGRKFGRATKYSTIPTAQEL